MSIQLGSAYGKVSLDVKGLRDGVKSGVSDLQNLAKVGEMVGATMEDIGKKLTIGVTLPILAMGAASISAASSFEETKNKAVVVFGEMASSVISNSNRAATSLKMSKTEYLNYASSLGAIFTAGGMGIKESTELAEQSVKHIADIGSFHEATAADVAAAWQSAIRGQYEPIQRYLPFITNEFLKTYGVANGMLDENTKNLTANQRAIILNAIALDEKLNPAVNDIAETGGSLANQTKEMQAQFKNLLITLGLNLLPIATKFITALNRMLDKFNQMTPLQQKMVIGFAGILAALGPVLTILGRLIQIVTFLGGAGTSITTLTTAFSGLGTTLSGAVVPAVGALGAALVPILAVLGSLLIYIGIFTVAWKNDWLFVRSAAETTIKILQALWNAFTAFLRGDTDEAMEYLGEAFEAFGEHINKVFEKIFNIRDAWGRFMTFMRDALGRTVTFIRDTFARIDWGLIGKFILQGLANGMLLGLPSLLATAAQVADSVLAQIKKSLGISSPSKMFAQLGMFSAQGFALGLQKGMNADDLARSIARPVTQMSSSQQQTIVQHFSNGVTLQQVRSAVDERVDALANQIINNLSF